MRILYVIGAIIVAPIWIWFVIKMKLRQIERRNRKDAPIELHLKN